MSFHQLKNAEKQTRRFFRKKYGIFWKRKVNPKKQDWISCEEYYKKFKQELKKEETK